MREPADSDRADGQPLPRRRAGAARQNAWVREHGLLSSGLFETRVDRPLSIRRIRDRGILYVSVQERVVDESLSRAADSAIHGRYHPGDVQEAAGGGPRTLARWST